jgi:large subunit ribosomal protein L3
MLIKGIKQQMSQVFLDSGRVIPVTHIKTETDISEDLQNKKAVIEGVSKGHGFTGVMKKWNFKGEMATRGQSNKPRQAGSIGGQTPGRVWPGKKMAGRDGNKKVTLKGVTIVKVNTETKELLLSGPVPGARNSLVKIKVTE